LRSALPITITLMGGGRALRPVMLPLTQANGRLVQALRRQSRSGRHLLVLVPTIQRQTVATLRAAARAGHPITGRLAVQTLAASASRVMNNAQRVQQAVDRNALLRQRALAQPGPRRPYPSRPGDQRVVRGYPGRAGR
jgi:hypothetical protein